MGSERIALGHDREQRRRLTTPRPPGRWWGPLPHGRRHRPRSFSSDPTTYLATGLDDPDALAGTVAAARDDAPLLQTLTDCVTQVPKDAAPSLGATSRIVLGATGAVRYPAANLTVCQAPAPPPRPGNEPPSNPGDDRQTANPRSTLLPCPVGSMSSSNDQNLWMALGDVT